MLNRATEDNWILLESLETAAYVSEADGNAVLSLSRNPDPELRMRTAELLGRFPVAVAEPILLNLSFDTDVLVRTSACDSLSGCPDSVVYERLIQAASEDPFYLVRGYAVLSLGDIACTADTHRQQQMRGFLATRYRLEKNVWVKIACASSLYRLGCLEYLSYILRQIDNDNYRIRCLVLHILQEFAVPDTTGEIAAVLENHRQVEAAESVRCLLEEMTITLMDSE